MYTVCPDHTRTVHLFCDIGLCWDCHSVTAVPGTGIQAHLCLLLDSCLCLQITLEDNARLTLNILLLQQDQNGHSWELTKWHGLLHSVTWTVAASDILGSYPAGAAMSSMTIQVIDCVGCSIFNRDPLHRDNGTIAFSYHLIWATECCKWNADKCTSGNS